MGGQPRNPRDGDLTVSDREVVLTRILDAPRELIWEAWSDPVRLAKWWGPSGFSITIYKMDLRPGGVWESVMHGPDGTDYANNCVFVEVVRPERIVYRLLGGGRLEDRDIQAESSWIFEARGEQTKLTLRMLFPTREARDRAAAIYKVTEGGNETIDRLARYLSNT